MQNLVILVLLAVYSGGIWKFWKGFKRTNFAPGFSNRLRLAVFWPALLIANKSYRRNFQKALKG